MIRKDMFAGGRKYTFEAAATLRKQPTNAEQILWNYLKTKPLGIKFRRQHVYGVWVLDFYCHAVQLAIEVDGSIHDVDEVKQVDIKRQEEMEEIGLKFLRFTNHQVEHDLDKVKQSIENYIFQNLNKEEKRLPPKSPLQGDRGTTQIP